MIAPSDSALVKAAVKSLTTPRSSEPAWLLSMRSAAAKQFQSRGFPGPKDEAWRFTPVRPITRIPFQSAMSETPAGVSDQALAVLQNGVPQLLATPPAGVWVGCLADALREHPELVRSHLGRSAPPEDGFAALNAAVFGDALVIIVAPGAAPAPIEILYAASAVEVPTVAYPRVLVIAGRNSEATIVETHAFHGNAQHLHNSVKEVVLEDSARLSHLRFRSGPIGSFAIESVGVRQERDSRYRSMVVTFGGSLTRVGIDVRLGGKAAECTLDGLFMAGADEHVDHHTRVTHAVPHGQSNQRYKGVVSGNGTGVFDGIVVVARGAQGTEAHQQSKNLVLSGEAVVHTKPQLEIDADDVRCSHGATVGKLDEEQLFYLRTRGVDEQIARAALTYGFAREILDDIEPIALREMIGETALARLPHGSLAKELTA